jgi:hypothetical protein
MNNKFSFLILKIGFTNNRLSLLQKNTDSMCYLDKLEIDSLIRYKMYLTEKSKESLMDKSITQLADEFLEDNDLISPNAITKENHMVIFKSILQSTISSALRGQL